MQRQMPYFREMGAGTSVVCIHSSASSSGQWRALMERLAPHQAPQPTRFALLRTRLSAGRSVADKGSRHEE